MPDAAAACTKGQVAADEVVMIGDSYMDLGNVGPTIMKDANNAMYRHYYLAGAALNYESTIFNIPYQFDTMAETDTAVAMPTDIKVVIMDGGGNDVLINNSSCLTTPVAGDTTCHTAIDASVARGEQLEMDMASKGVQHIVYYFYPDLDSTVRAIRTRAPGSTTPTPRARRPAAAPPTCPPVAIPRAAEPARASTACGLTRAPSSSGTTTTRTPLPTGS